MKKILLLGGHGLLGKEISRLLDERRYVLIAPTSAQLDITDYQALESILKGEMPTDVINLAARRNIDELEKDPLPGWQVNTFGAAAIGRILSKHKIRSSYFFMSTSYVFGSSLTAKAEDDAHAPVNVYGETKSVAEELIVHYCGGTGIPFWIGRASWMYGRARESFVDEVAKMLLRGEKYEAAIDQSGNTTSAAEVAGAVVSLCIEKQIACGAYHFLNEDPGRTSRFDIAREIASALAISPERVVPAESRDIFSGGGRPSISLVNTKIPPLRNWREALREYIVTRYTANHL
ncbi:hypothetical protein A2851_02275 [Candidatus Kaiserbacteria bacterium RIFCSPHIGHO2_01_FULL_53_29]|uniref:dTDP-4-dehydrorhamnose reductase n=1 Tax=Candidatus Kaiserbacteria bacterium RIFCSPHIGHO2_01_FULL_53_29 TaxID=1798480 RepID=A0A1F6CX04_9BACT|nr:MAG: hypothetical protein A2851_02275 [Candidatus Kaiserbacteria bacterium RIFCSPHIGHO2_01_FULL_53_29]